MRHIPAAISKTGTEKGTKPIKFTVRLATVLEHVC